MINIVKTLWISVLLVFFSAITHAREVGDTTIVYFHAGSARLDLTYKNNAARVDKLVSMWQQFPQGESPKVTRFEVLGTASPEGSLEINARLAESRYKALLRVLKEKVDIPDSLIVTRMVHEDWHNLALAVSRDTVIFDKQTVVEILDRNDEHCLDRVRNLDKGITYRYINRVIFPELRVCRVVLIREIPDEVTPITVSDKEAEHSVIISAPVLESVMEQGREPVPESKQEPVEPVAVETPVSNCPDRYFSIKTNALGWMMLHSNVAIELPLAPHVSLAVPFYYSGGLDYFKPTIKFRGIVLQPEVRYYPWLQDGKNGGFYVGAHLGLGWYNFALNSEWRIQDHKGTRPSWGGGLGLGYALQFKRNPNWGMEFCVGGGVYDSLYDVFYNEPNGPYHKKAVHKIWYGIDNVSLSFTYRFDLGKKGGDR